MLRETCDNRNEARAGLKVVANYLIPCREAGNWKELLIQPDTDFEFYGTLKCNLMHANQKMPVGIATTPAMADISVLLAG